MILFNINYFFSKKDVKSLLDIPVFTEEIIYVEQNNIERNIYNSIRASRHFIDTVKNKRLFLMCTNILINEGYDFQGNSDIPATAEILTLEQLNSNMISRFNDQLKLVVANAKRMQQDNELLVKNQQQWQDIVNYIESLDLENKIEKPILEDIKKYFELQYKKEIIQQEGTIIKPKERPNVKWRVEFVYNILDIFMAYNEPKNAGMIIYNNYFNIKTSMSNQWRETWETENIMTWLAQQGAELGVIKCTNKIKSNTEKLNLVENDKKRISNQIALFSNNEFLKDKVADPCIICFEDLKDIVVTPCRHIFCMNCTNTLSCNLTNKFNCPECRNSINCNTLNITTVENITNSNKNDINKKENNSDVSDVSNPLDASDATSVSNVFMINKFSKEWKATCTNKYGSKMSKLVEYLYELFNDSKQNRVIIFSQYDKMLKMIGQTLDEFQIQYVYCHGNNAVINKNINRFKKDESIRVIMLSSETSNSGSNLTEANYIIFIDVLHQDLEHVKAIEAQAIGRAVRLGQKLPVKVIRFITKDTIEDEHYKKNKYDMNILQE